MDHLGSLLTTGLAIVSIATLAGLGLMRGTVTNLRERLGDYEKEVSEKDRRLTAAEQKIAQQANDLRALGRVVTGEAHWVSIGAKLDEHHEEAKVHWANDEESLSKILAALEKLT